MYFDMKGVMVKFPYVAGLDMSLPQAEIYMGECDIRHLPIIENNEIKGVISERDLLRYKAQPDFSKLTTGEIINHPPFVVTEHEPLAKTLSIMRENKYGSALIVNHNSQIIGIFTTTDALLLLENLVAADPKPVKETGNVIFMKDVVAWN